MGEERSWRVAWTAIGNPLVALSVLAVLSAGFYLLLFVHPWDLLALHQRPLLDLRRISSDNPLARWLLLAGFSVLGVLYWLGWRVASRIRSPAGWVPVLGGAAVSSAILLFLFPFDAADVFDNIMHGRILGVYGGNPFVQVAADFEGDPFLPYVAWRHTPSAYGPGWELVAAATASLAGDGVVANVLAIKALGGVFLAGSIGIVAVLLRRTAPDRALAGVLLLAWNPLVLVMSLGFGHNDIAMVFWILLSVFCLAHHRYTLSVLSLVMGMLFKFIPLLLLPAAGLIALRAMRGWRSRLRFLLVTTVAAGLLVVLAYAPFWQGFETLGIERRRALLTTSLPATVYALLEAPLGAGPAASGVSLAAAIATALFALWQAVRACRKPSLTAFVRASFAILMFYLLFTCLWFHPWYAVWPLSLVPLLPPGHFSWLGVAFGFAVLSKPLIFEPMWLWSSPLPVRSWRELRLGPAVLAVPWLLTLVALFLGRRARYARRQLPPKARHRPPE